MSPSQGPGPYVQQPHMTYQQNPGQPQMHQQGSYGMPPPQQQYQQQPMQPMQQGGGGTQFQTAVAIPNLGMGSAPVDCPSCGKRGMTRLEYATGNTTQYVYPFPSIALISHPSHKDFELQHGCDMI
jgi:hypothetical protein